MKLSQWLNKKNRAEENKMIRVVRNSDLFDERWYVSQYQDVFKKLKDPARHYYQKGWAENRNPSENFSTAEYLRRYPECNICPLVFEHNRNDHVDLSVCAIMKNEAPYVKEWIDYHLSVGVKRFYIYDNESTDYLREELDPYIAKGLVVYKYYPGEARQMPAYNECIREYGDKSEWMAFIDADEFIMPVEKDSIPEFLKEFKDCAGVGINWICYDSDGHKNKPQGGVLENYTRVHFDEQFFTNHHIKSIVKPAMVEGYINPYYAQYIDGKNAVDENGNEIKGCVYREVHPKAFTDTVSVNKIRINHYYSKSEEEYKAKLERGRALVKGRKKPFSVHSLVFDDVAYDYTAYKYLERLQPELAQKLKIKTLWLNIKNIFVSLKHMGKPRCLFDYVDEKWYFEQYPDAAKSGMTALQHYMSIGWKEGKNPSIYFDTNFYLKRYPDIAEAGINPLMHYLSFGKSAGRLPKIGDNLSDDNAEQLKILLSKVDKTSADYKILDNSELFDKEWYINTYFNGLDIDPVAHYLSLGWKEGKNPSKDFDTEFYLKKYSDIAKTGHNPFLHYIKHGKEEGRLPKFNGSAFKRFWKRINGTEFEDDGFVSPHEMSEEYRIVEKSKLFNSKWYARKYLQGQNVNPIEHYLTAGWKEGNNPSTKFDTAEYLKQYPECEVCPLVFEYNRNEHADLAVCAIMKDEAAYLKEWIDYHRLVGVRRFYIYDNDSTDNIKEVLAPYITQGVVIYKFYPGEAKQIPAYNDCVKEYKNENKWIAFIDADEFIVPVEKETVPEFLEEYKKYPAVEMCWVNYDSNGHVARPAGGVLESYPRRQYEIQSLRNHRGKSIVQPSQVKKMHVHNATYLNDKIAVTTDKKPADSNGFADYVCVDKIRLHHYYCKSKEESIAKVAKGNAYRADKIRKVSDKDLCFDEYIYDTIIFKFLKRLYPNKAFKYTCLQLVYGVKNIFIDLHHKLNKNTMSDYINEQWYFEQYPEAAKSGMTALQHYMSIGWKEGKNPSEMFDTKFYLEKYKDIAETGHCPLLHYITYGKSAGRLPKPEAKPLPIKEQKQLKTQAVEIKQEETAEKKSPKTDYEILDNSELFDKEWYANTYLNGSNMDPITHYLSFGWKNGFNPSKDFDTEFYLKKYPDITKRCLNPLLHYLKHGKEEGRLAKSQYNLLQYLFGGISFIKKPFISEYGVTVIVPTYNRKNYLEKALNTLKSQTLKNIKFIIVDDGSTDGSAEYIEKAIEGDKRFVLIKNDTNQGPSVARNKALDLSKTEYVGFFDIDDEIPTDYYEKLYEQAIKSSADIVFTCYNDVKHRIKKISEKADKYSALRNGAIWDKLYNTAMLKKNNIKFTENLYTADNLFNIEAFHAANKIVLTDEPRYSYELHNDSIGKDEKLTEKRKEDIISICTKAVNFAKGHGFDFPSRIGLYDFLKRTYDCYADDTSFQAKLQSVLKKTGVKVNVGQVMTKYNKKEYKMIEDSAYFNPEYYKRHNPQLWFSSVNPVEHYLTIGWLKGKNPSAEFDGNKYLIANEDVSKAGMNPLIHFVEHGVNEERSCEAVKSVGEEIQYALTYPIRVKEEYDRLVAEIKALENMK